MKEDASLFRYELAIVAILKNEAPYVKEWLDYHLLAGVDHFYIYDNDSTDNMQSMLQPYIGAEVVDYTPMPGKCAQMLAYHDAVDKHKFDCRYMAFLDGDEFLLPRGGFQSIKDVLRQTIDNNPNAVALTVNWHTFGSNGLEKADYEKGVLERFTRRAPNDFDVDRGFGNGHVKTIANPRLIDSMTLPHCATYYLGKFAVDENGNVVPGYFNPNVPDKKIIINHYSIKSKEEFNNKIARGYADSANIRAKMEDFLHTDKVATVFDDEIIKYRQALYEKLSDAEGNLTLEFDSSETINRRLLNSVVQHLIPLTMSFPNNEPFSGRLHEFLTCRAVSHSFYTNEVLDRSTAEFLEELSLRCAYRAMAAGALEVWQLLLLLDELPKILTLVEYDVVEQIQEACRQLLPQLMMQYRMRTDWIRYKQLDYLFKMLE